ncbi:MAG: hypothetical protein FWF76_05535 [Oscillospiraceae bacterium]|nr:hypothetical protein [Oscillospiraceae bacterium]
MKEKKNELENKGLNLKKLFANEKSLKAMIIGGLALIAMLFLSSIFDGDNTPSYNRHSQESEISNDTVSEYEIRLENKLKRAVSALDGVGELTIVVTLDSVSETVYAERGSGVRTIITPRVRGVAIIAEGADNPIIKAQITELASRLLGVNTTRISVNS